MQKTHERRRQRRTLWKEICLKDTVLRMLKRPNWQDHSVFPDGHCVTELASVGFTDAVSVSEQALMMMVGAKTCQVSTSETCNSSPRRTEQRFAPLEFQPLTTQHNLNQALKSCTCKPMMTPFRSHNFHLDHSLWVAWTPAAEAS